MGRKVVLHPAKSANDKDMRVGGWWHELSDGMLCCDLCPRRCVLATGKRGFCFVRQNVDGQLVSKTYGRSTGFCIDPIEKKPLYQFYPGTAALSFGTAGCNLGCKFCQNWTTTKSRAIDESCEAADPSSIARAAETHSCRSVAFTYNDPIVWAEYAIDTAMECRKRGVKTVAVTSGYMQPDARGPFFECMDAANVDLKGFDEGFYRALTGGHLEPVLDTLRWLANKTEVWLEITNLVIPHANDSPKVIRAMCEWILHELGPDVPVHFTAFHPDFQMVDREPTPSATLAMSYETAKSTGLHYVYTGNTYDPSGQSTICPQCARVVIERVGYELGDVSLEGGCCKFCGTQIAGVFEDSPGNWGSKRLPIHPGA